MLILIALGFLVWAFFTHITHISLANLGEIRSGDLLSQLPKRFFYAPLNRWVFKEVFDPLLLASKISALIGWMGFAGAILLFLVQLSTLIALAWVIVAAVLAVFVGIGAGYVAPYLIASDKGLVFSLPVSSLFLYLSTPITLPLIKLILWLEEKEDVENELEIMKETIIELLQRANVSGKLSAMDKKLLEAVVRFKDRIVREVMVPRVDLFCLPVTTTIREAATQLAEEGYSRTPVYRDTVDNVIGILMFRDLLEIYMDCESGKREKELLDQTIETFVKRAFYTPETKRVPHLLQEFRTRQMHMAIVVDEYGGTEGVVTIEDLLEEIVGEISDEYDDDDEALYTAQPGGAIWIVDARMSIFDAEEAFGVHIPQEGDYDTIGGYIFEKLKTIPKKGEKIEHEEFDLEVLSSTMRSVEKVKISKKKKSL